MLGNNGHKIYLFKESVICIPFFPLIFPAVFFRSVPCHFPFGPRHCSCSSCRLRTACISLASTSKTTFRVDFLAADLSAALSVWVSTCVAFPLFPRWHTIFPPRRLAAGCAGSSSNTTNRFHCRAKAFSKLMRCLRLGGKLNFHFHFQFHFALALTLARRRRRRLSSVVMLDGVGDADAWGVLT